MDRYLITVVSSNITTCKNMAKTTKEPVFLKQGKYLSFFTHSSLNIIDRLGPTRYILAMKLQVNRCKFKLTSNNN